MRKTKMICLVVGIVVVAVAAVLFASVLRREPPSVSQDPPAVSPSPTTPAPAPEPEPTSTPEPAPEVTPTLEPTEPPYDVWSDPNVLWAEAGWQLDELYRGNPMLQGLIESAKEENLIVFCVESYSSEFNTFELNVDELFIPPELDPDGELLDMVEEYCELPKGKERTKLYWDGIHEYLRKMVGDYLAEDGNGFVISNLRDRQRAMKDSMVNKILEDWGTTWRDSEKHEQATKLADELLLKDEEYQEIANQLIYYSYMEDLVSLFRDSWMRQEAEWIRERFVELGFTPLYELNDVPRLTYFTTRKAARAFLGTAEQLRNIGDMLGEDESAFLAAIPKEMLDDPIDYGYMN